MYHNITSCEICDIRAALTLFLRFTSQLYADDPVLCGVDHVKYLVSYGVIHGFGMSIELDRVRVKLGSRICAGTKRG